MADYAIIIKACSKIVCHALKQRQCYGYCFQAFLLGYLLFIPIFFYVRLYWVTHCLFIPQCFLLGPLRDVNLSVDLITYFTVIQTDTFHISTLLITQHTHNDRHWAYFKYY